MTDDAPHIGPSAPAAEPADRFEPPDPAVPADRSVGGADGMTYESAVERLEQVIARLDSGQADLRETLALCREGKRMIEFAAGELDAVGRGLEELRLDELVERLEARPASGGPPAAGTEQA